MSENTKLRLGVDTFIDDFQKDHSKLNALFVSFRKAIQVSNRKKAKEILCEINDIIEGHFNFEETYLYPRLRRLVSEITTNLQNGQETMWEFVSKSRNFLEDSKASKDKLNSLLGMLPGLSGLLSQCNDLLPLAKRFNEEDRIDLDKRFKECRK